MVADPLNDEGIRELADVLTKNRVATILSPPAPLAAGPGAALVRRLRRQAEAVRLLPHCAGRPLQVQSDLPGGRVGTQLLLQLRHLPARPVLPAVSRLLRRHRVPEGHG